MTAVLLFVFLSVLDFQNDSRSDLQRFETFYRNESKVIRRMYSKVQKRENEVCTFLFVRFILVPKIFRIFLFSRAVLEKKTSSRTARTNGTQSKHWPGRIQVTIAMVITR